MKERGTVKRLCQCIGLASLMLVVNYNDLLSGGKHARMHAPYRLTAVCLAQIADIFLLGLVFFAVWMLLARTRFYSWARLLVMMFVPSYLIERCHPLIPINISDGALIALTVAWVALLLLFVLEYPRAYQLAIRVGDAVGIFAAVFALFTVAQILVVMRWSPGPQTIRAAWETGPQPPRMHRRIVWVIFDELSYDQTFGNRAKDLALPNFDALRSQSTLYTEIQPSGYKTVKVIPSLLSGEVIDDFDYHFDNRLFVQYEGKKGWHLLDGSETVFHDAQQAGWRTAAVGWYNPYCSLYRSALDSCYWTDQDGIGADTEHGESFWENARIPLNEIGEQVDSPELAAKDDCDLSVRLRLQSHFDLEHHWMKLLKDDQADFVFIHIPIPHSPNIWSRSRGTYVQECGSSYLDNLALADKELGVMMGLLQASPRWKDTTMIVEGDHSWRIALWNWQHAWTPEDERASHGVFDPRPALLIHDAGQTEPQTDARAIPLLSVHTAIENVLHGR